MSSYKSDFHRDQQFEKKISHIFVTYLVGLECTNIFFLLFIKIYLEKNKLSHSTSKSQNGSLSLDFSIFL